MEEWKAPSLVLQTRLWQVSNKFIKGMISSKCILPILSAYVLTKQDMFMSVLHSSYTSTFSALPFSCCFLTLCLSMLMAVGMLKLGTKSLPPMLRSYFLTQQFCKVPDNIVSDLLLVFEPQEMTFTCILDSCVSECGRMWLFQHLGIKLSSSSCATDAQMIPQASNPYSCVLLDTKHLSRISRESFLFR